MHAANSVVVGLDIGGSKTRGMVWVNGKITADASADSANVQNVSVETARANLADLFTRLNKPNPGKVFAGSGGVDSDADVAALKALIAPLVSGAAITVVHDTRLLLAAGGSATGVAVIAGTGSAAWGAGPDGRESRAGGWGYLLGDEGSGYWLARESVRHSLHRMDLGLPKDQLTQGLLDYCGIQDPGQLIAHFHQGTSRRYWAAASPVVFAAGDNGNEAALRFIDQAGADLAAMAAQVAGQLQIQGPIVLGSGLGSNVPALQEAFTKHLQGFGLHDVHILKQDPIFGVPLLVQVGKGVQELISKVD